MARIIAQATITLLLVFWSRAVQAGKTTADPRDLYSSLVHVEGLFTFDQLVGHVLLHLPEHIPAASRYLDTYRSVVVDRGRELEISGNPLHVYAVIKRLVLHWPEVSQALHAYEKPALRGCQDTMLECGTWALNNECLINRNYMLHTCPRACHTCIGEETQRLVKEVREAASTTLLPTLGDLRGAALALSRLQKVYRIPVSSFMAGHLANVTSALRLELEDCLRVANTTYQHGLISYALTWFHYCHAHQTALYPAHPVDIPALIREVQNTHNDYWASGGEDFYEQPISPSSGQRILKDAFEGPVCRGQHRNVPRGSTLRCHNSPRGSPLLQLNPARFEQLHRSPELYLFHDVISPAEISTLKNISRGLLERATVFVSDSNNTYVARPNPVRTADTSFLSSRLHPFLARLGRRVEALTGLKVQDDPQLLRADQDLQVQNYGTGGHYGPHIDVLFRFMPEEQLSDCVPNFKPGCDEMYQHGDRLATFMIYLSDVIAGGRTAFPVAGISIPPAAGSAVFWYNLKRSGAVDYNTRHCGCPVILGHKWVANKWIREHGNFLHRPCSDNSQE